MTTDGAVQLFNKATLIYTHHVVSHPPLSSEGDGESRTAIASSPESIFAASPSLFLALSVSLGYIQHCLFHPVGGGTS